MKRREKMKNKKVMAGLLSIGILLGASGVSAVQSGNFTDVKEGDWFYQAVTSLQQQGIINGYQDGSFKPNKTVTRAEVAQMIHNAQQTENKEIPSIEEPAPESTAKEDSVQEHTLNLATTVEPAPTEPTSSISDVIDYRYYLDSGSETVVEGMKQNDLVIVEPVVMEQQYIEEAQSAGTLIYGYINSMEADNWNTELMERFREEAFYHDENGDRLYIDLWDAYLMDISNPHYQDVMLEEIGNRIVERGLDGVFLDTVGSIEDYHSGNPAVMKQQQAGMKVFMQRIKETYPGLSIAQNWGFDTLENYTAPYIDFIMWESFNAADIQSDPWYTDNINMLKSIREQHGVEVFVVAFEDEAASKQIADEHGFKNVFNAEGSYYNKW